MYSATFIFDIRQFDSEFHRLDALIAAAAKETEGYLGKEAWGEKRPHGECLLLELGTRSQAADRTSEASGSEAPLQ